MGKLQGKVIVMAGAGSIGGECARLYAREGASVVLGDVRKDIAEETVEEIKSAGGKAVAAQLEGGDEQSIKDIIDLAVKTYGGLDGVHPNFACVKEGIAGTSVLDVPLDLYDEIMNVNAKGFFLCTRYALPHLIERGGGAIVYTGAGAATAGEVTRIAYGMSKAAIQLLARHVAIKFGPQGVRANTIAPGAIERLPTRGRDGTPDEVREICKKFSKIPRMGRPIDIAAMCALLMSDDGSYITGQVINIDGGVTMRP